MNLANNPTEAQLAQVSSAVNDDSDTHVFWVDQGGEVHLDGVRSAERLPTGHPIWFGPKARFWWESFASGGKYVGIEGANDAAWVKKFFKEITYLWNSGFQGYSDYWQAP